MTRHLAAPTVVATPAATRLHYLKRSKRKVAPIRRSFVQMPPGSEPRWGPLSQFVRKGDKRGLNAYLYLIAITSSNLGGSGWTYRLDSRIWARAFETTASASTASALTAVVRILDRLQDHNLITWERENKRSREISITLLNEDGSGDPYTRPGNNNIDAFINLPFAYWYGDWHRKLSVPGIAMLLVASAEYRGFTLPTHRMEEWYGWSPDTAERGFKELGQQKAVTYQQLSKPVPQSPVGFTVLNHYSLRAPFKHRRRGKAKARDSKTA